MALLSTPAHTTVFDDLVIAYFASRRSLMIPSNIAANPTLEKI